MSSLWSDGMYGKHAVVLGFLAVVVAATVALAQSEEPIHPHSVGEVLCAFGGVEVQPEDVGGLSIDAKDSIEPQTTALLVTTDVNTSPGQTVVVQTSPVFDNWVSGSGY
jgi:hypothetical protein